MHYSVPVRLKPLVGVERHDASASADPLLGYTQGPSGSLMIDNEYFKCSE